MIYYFIGPISFVAIFGDALFGVFAARVLPEHHLTGETRTAVSVSVAVVGTLSALVIGLMISTASSSFTARSHDVTEISVDLIRMKRLLQRYGSESDDVRTKLSAYTTAKMQELFPTTGESAETDEGTIGMLEAIQDAILSLSPTDERHHWLRLQALTLSGDLSQARWLLAQQARQNIPLPFLILLISWLTIVFASFGLFSPRNGTAIAALCLCSIAVSGGIMMILELDTPLTGLVRISAEPMRHALTQIMP